MPERLPSPIQLGRDDNAKKDGILRSSEWFNVLIHVEEIPGIVFRLDLLESFVVWTIGSD